MTGSTLSGRQRALKGFAAARPDPELKLSEWSEQKMVLSGEYSASRGRFHAIPYQVGIMDAMTAHPAHEFWPLEEMSAKVWGDVLGRIQARRQWTDARLLVEAERRDGGVVTFDHGMRNLAGERLGQRVLVLG